VTSSEGPVITPAAGILVAAITLSGRDPTVRREATAAERPEASSYARQTLAEEKGVPPTRCDLGETEEAVDAARLERPIPASLLRRGFFAQMADARR